MSSLIIGMNNRGLNLIPRAASHSMAAAALLYWHKDAYDKWQESSTKHPAHFLPDTGWPCNHPQELTIAIIVRNPIERFRSMCAHKLDKTLEEHLSQQYYGILPRGDFKYFLFETQLDECAEWLGLPTPLPHIDASTESNKPILTPDQEAIVRQIYAEDIVLWESLQSK